MIRSESNRIWIESNRMAKWSANKFPFLEICAILCNATFQFSRKQKFPFLEICVTSRDNHGIESNLNRSNSIRSNSNRLNSIRDSIESNSNLTQFDSIRFDSCGTLVTTHELRYRYTLASNQVYYDKKHRYKSFFAIFRWVINGSL